MFYRNEVTIYPNPASTSLTLTLSYREGEVPIYIYDMLGNSVYHSTLNTQRKAVNIHLQRGKNKNPARQCAELYII
ncbi:MAG TPA: T9SS type A sorting domain-containing protein [Bacteroidia bacterium]